MEEASIFDFEDLRNFGTGISHFPYDTFTVVLHRGLGFSLLLLLRCKLRQPLGSLASIAQWV